MIFNNRDIESFSYTKAVKFDASFYSDFERQEITFRGLLRSYLEIPVVRKINVSVIARDRNKYELENKIHDITDWLYAAGIAKLVNKRDMSRYFKARCVSVSVPTFSGSTAKFVCEFECSDFRPFRTLDDEPIGSATQLSSNFSFNGRHCLNDMKCLFVPDSVGIMPAVTRNAYQISGRSGTLRYDDGPAILSEKRLPGKLYFLKDNNSTELMTSQEISDREHTIASWLINSGRAVLILDSDAGRYYDAEVIDQSDVKTEGWANGVMSVTFVLQPYCQDIEPKVIESSKSFSANSWKEIALSAIEEVGYTTPLVIQITNDGSDSITDLSIQYYNEKDEAKELRFNGNSFAIGAGQTLTINSISYDATKGAEAALKFIKSGDFPVVTPDGRKKIRIKSNVATTLGVTVTAKPRWL